MSGGIYIYGKRRGRLVKVVVRFREERGKCCIEIWEYEGFRDSFTDEVFWRKGYGAVLEDVEDVEEFWGFLKEFLVGFLPSDLSKKRGVSPD